MIIDGTGNLMEIRVDAVQNPSFAEEVRRLWDHWQDRSSGRSEKGKPSDSKMRKKSKPLSQSALLQLLQKAEASGLMTEAEFYQMHPQWRRDDRSS